MPRIGLMLPATSAGTATPVPATIHAARHNGHFGSRIAITPGNTLPIALTHHRAGPAPDSVPRASQQRAWFTTTPSVAAGIGGVRHFRIGVPIVVADPGHCEGELILVSPLGCHVEEGIDAEQ